MKYAIFDFDGTLADTFEATIQAHSILSGKPYEATKNDMLVSRLVKPRYTKDRIYTDTETEDLLKFREEEYKLKENLNIKLFEPFIQELKKIKDLKMAVVSTAYQPVLEKFCTITELPFTHVIGFGPNFSKQTKMEEIAKSWGIDLSEVYFITDTIRDVVEAKEFLSPEKIIGCGWGFHGTERLAEVLPDRQILKEYHEIHQFLS